jgi:hypothetical protein
MTEPFSHNIVVRMRDCLERQILWFRELLQQLTLFSAQLVDSEEIEDEEFAGLVKVMDGAAKKTNSLKAEFDALKHEWDTCETISPGEREELQALGKEAESLSTKLSTLYTDNSNLLRNTAASQRIELATMQRLSASMRKYRSDQDGDDPLLDQKA